MTDQYQCQSYAVDGKIYDCTCGKCEVGPIEPKTCETHNMYGTCPEHSGPYDAEPPKSAELDKVLDILYAHGQLEVYDQLAKKRAKAAIEAIIETRVTEALGTTIELPTLTGFQIIAYNGREQEWRSHIYGREVLPAHLSTPPEEDTR